MEINKSEKHIKKMEMQLNTYAKINNYTVKQIKLFVGNETVKYF